MILGRYNGAGGPYTEGPIHEETQCRKISSLTNNMNTHIFL